MSVTYGFFNSVNHDRKYDASQFSRLFEGVFNDGVFASIGTGLVVVSNPLVPMGVNVGIGRAWFDLTWTDNDAILPLEVAAAHPILNRIDAVVIEVDFTEAVRANSIKIVTGTAASNPSNPAMVSTELVHQHPLAYIYVTAGVTEITPANITNRVGTSDCPFVTGLLQVLTIDTILTQWNGQFDDWFENVKAQLEGDVVTNLQRQIDERIAVSDNMSNADIDYALTD
jgi:hypothetical protein